MLAAYNIRFVDACRKMRIFYKKDRETGLRVYLLDGIASPFLLGRAVYLAPWMTGERIRLRYMILHEYCHYRQGDTVTHFSFRESWSGLELRTRAEIRSCISVMWRMVLPLSRRFCMREGA